MSSEFGGPAHQDMAKEARCMTAGTTRRSLNHQQQEVSVMTMNPEPCPPSARELSLSEHAELVASTLAAAVRLVGTPPAPSPPLSMWAGAVSGCTPPAPEPPVPVGAIF